MIYASGVYYDVPAVTEMHAHVTNPIVPIIHGKYLHENNIRSRMFAPVSTGSFRGKSMCEVLQQRNLSGRKFSENFASDYFLCSD